MKNKQLLYILISVTVIIWSLIIYKLSIWLKDENIKHITNKKVIQRSEIQKAPESFHLLENYPDPFGIKPKQINVPGKCKTEITWPKVEFFGTIQSYNKQFIASLRINEKEVILSAGDTCNQIKLLHVNDKFIRIEFMGEKKKIEITAF